MYRLFRNKLGVLCQFTNLSNKFFTVRESTVNASKKS